MPAAPFRAYRYQDPTPQVDPGVMDLSTVLTPIDLLPDSDEPDPASGGYSAADLIAAARRSPSALLDLWQGWVSAGVLGQDAEPVVYLYRCGWKDAGGSHTGSGVLVLNEPAGHGGDALQPALVPSTVTVSAEQLSPLMAPPGLPLARGTDMAGTHHRLWALQQTGIVEAIISLVNEALEPATPTGLIAATPDGCVPPLGLVYHW